MWDQIPYDLWSNNYLIFLEILPDKSSNTCSTVFDPESENLSSSLTHLKILHKN